MSTFCNDYAIGVKSSKISHSPSFVRYQWDTCFRYVVKSTNVSRTLFHLASSPVSIFFFWIWSLRKQCLWCVTIKWVSRLRRFFYTTPQTSLRKNSKLFLTEILMISMEILFGSIFHMFLFLFPFACAFRSMTSKIHKFIFLISDTLDSSSVSSYNLWQRDLFERHSWPLFWKLRKVFALTVGKFVRWFIYNDDTHYIRLFRPWLFR